ncbi:MAG: multidrug effflux MFS transporter [Boseongicola sp. SB0677_bin_26]|nr:multidrug effflux MFS transporter [Boseongicola sp. SB0665_bin_10]MYG24935.1 multidrug effflux MFS transporter [Boseongicola sp. SB0677_bin_26]
MAVTLALLSALPLLSLNMFLPSLGVMAEDFGVGYDEIALTFSLYLAFTAVFQVCSGILADRFGRKPVLMWCILVFSASSVGCLLSDGYPEFLVFRCLQSSVVSGMVLSRAIVRDLFDRTRTAKVLGYIATAMSLAPILGPLLGGILAEVGGWRHVFGVYFLSGVLLLILVGLKVPETDTRCGRPEESPSGPALALFLDSRFWQYTSIMTLATGTFYVFVSGVPIVATEHFMMSQAETGLGLGTITVGFLAGSFASGRLLESFGPHTVILWGRLAAGVGLAACVCLLWVGWEMPVVLFGCTSLAGFGNGLTMPSASALVMFVRPDRAASASGLSDAVIVIAGAALATLTGHVLGAAPDALVLVCLMLPLAMVSLGISVFMSLHAGETEAED